MSYCMNFGKYEGETFEWVFFHDPCYIQWMIKNVHANVSKFSPEARARFEELERRASHLRIPGYCAWCAERPITRIFLTFNTRKRMMHVHFDCDRCRPEGSSYSQPFLPSLFVLDDLAYHHDSDMKVFVAAIKRAYFGKTSVKLTQKRLEEFFDDPDNFVNY